MAAPKYIPAYCPKCKDQVMAIGQRPNHIIHLALTFLTGFWIIVWAIIVLRRGSLKCVKCGSEL